MSENTSSLIVEAKWKCDATRCTNFIHARFDPKDDVNYFTARQVIEHHATGHGWTVYASRGRRNYCPWHHPKPGHTMTPAGGRIDARDLAAINETDYELDWNY